MKFDDLSAGSDNDEEQKVSGGAGEQKWKNKNKVDPVKLENKRNLKQALK